MGENHSIYHLPEPKLWGKREQKRILTEQRRQGIDGVVDFH